ncbi:DUF4124 domain-containing protein [Oceanobacter mangrovi]|uniref:DUF4124 domain-containing protein n=1 Tax=Oceanobacter mangrovi TaxID=2862510 RepID=UPI001C8D9B6B|nr:DUF4124 domain-containing protein [Oceanobacter mangrovi]
MIRSSLVGLLASLIIAAPVSAGIYKWTDANGKVHYGDRPPQAVQATGMNIANNPSPVSAGNQDAARQQAQKAFLEQRQQERQQQAEAKAQQQQADAKAQAQKDYCTSMRGRTQEIEAGGRPMYRYNEKGEREYLQESELASAREEFVSYYKKVCG